MKQRILVAVVGVPALLAVLCAAPDWGYAGPAHGTVHHRQP